MTTYNLRNIPHPVLSPVGQDYRDECSFRANVRNVRRSEDDGSIIIAIEYELNEPNLLKMIQSGEAQYITLTRCPGTRIREAHPCREERQEIVLESAMYLGEIQIDSLVTATRDIPGFHSPKWTPELLEFIPQGTDIPAAAILAFADPTISNAGDTKQLESCLAIIPSENTPQGEFDVSLEDNLIAISINPGDMPSLERMRGDERSQAKLWPSMYLAAIERAIREHRDEEHEGKQWVKTISDKLRENEMEASDPDILKAKSLPMAQRLMEQPLRRIIEDDD